MARRPVAVQGLPDAFYPNEDTRTRENLWWVVCGRWDLANPFGALEFNGDGDPQLAALRLAFANEIEEWRATTHPA